MHRDSPHAVSNESVSMQTHHLVFVGDVMEERVLVIGEERVWDPDLFCEVAGQGHRLAAVLVLGEGQTIVGPVLVQVDRDGVILKRKVITLRHH